MAKTAPPARADGANVVSSTPSSARKGKKHVRSIRTTRAKGGGHVVEHEFDHTGGDYSPPAQHVFGKDEGVKHMKHYMRHAGVSGVKVSASTGDTDGATSGDDPTASEGDA